MTKSSFRILGAIVSASWTAFGYKDCFDDARELEQWYLKYFKCLDNHLAMKKRTQALLNATCSDGTLKLSDVNYDWFKMYLDFYKSDMKSMEEMFWLLLQQYERSIWLNFNQNTCSNLLFAMGGGLIKGASCAFISARPALGAKLGEIGNRWLKNVGGAFVEGGIENALSKLLNGVQSKREKLYEWYTEEERKIVSNIIDHQKRIVENYRNCPDDDEEDNDEEDDGGDDKDDDFPAPSITPIVDPSGYVYEAVPSNRIQGVTATAYYKQQHEDMFGDITETAEVWDAAPFNQENPLTTDAKGMYAWDVPAGMWQVRFEKEGYEPAQSEWLPVPPPQLDVNIAMTQAKQPEVVKVHAYSDGVTVEFDKFMLPSTLSAGNITVTQNGNIVNGEIEAKDMELDVNGNAFCSKIEFRPENPLAEGEATLFVSKAVKSYANISMSEDFMQTFAVEPRVSEIKVDENITVNSGSTMTLHASVLPASAATGKTVLIESLNPMIASVSSEKLAIDDKGNITFDVSGLILGTTGIRLSIEDYDIEAMVNVNVLPALAANQVATPYASVESGEIKFGTEICLYCDTKDATIYYTTDGSCPCDIDRLEYDGTPIVADKDFTLKIMAVVEGMTDSDIAEYQYTVSSSGIDDIISQELSIYPLPLGEYLYISNRDRSIDSVSIYDLNGKMLIHSDKSENQVSLKVGFLSPGVYILNVKTNGQTISKKVIKR